MSDPLLLLPDIGTVLAVTPSADPDLAADFAETFRAAWLHIPTAVRRLLVRHWLAGGDGWPLIVLAPELRNLGSGGFCYGECLEHGRRFDFSAAAVSSLDDRQAGSLVAHELGHGVFIAGKGRSGSEKEVDRLVA